MTVLATQLPPRRPRVRGFSLVEVLLSIFILGIGLIMVASIFPVGANWTRQATEETVGQTIAQNALSVIEQYYGAGGACSVDIKADFFTNKVLGAVAPNSPFLVQSMPGFQKIPVDLRSYQFGSSVPYPAPNPAGCTYFWTALCRLNPSQYIVNPTTNNVFPAGQYKYDVYILVFRKGDATQAFESNASTRLLPGTPLGGTLTDQWFELAGTRDLATEGYIPYVVQTAWRPGTFVSGGTPPLVDAIPPLGTIGIGVSSGTVFRQGFNPLAGSPHAVPRPLLIQTSAGPPPLYEDVIWAPGPNIIGPVQSRVRDTYLKSPLIYVYQTTLSL